MDDTMNSLKRALQALALPSDKQIRWLRSNDAKVPELASGYFEGRHGMTKKDKLRLTPQQAVLLETMDRLIKTMVNLDEADLWTEAGLKKNSRWIAVREMAGVLLQSFEWESEAPTMLGNK